MIIRETSAGEGRDCFPLFDCCENSAISYSMVNREYKYLYSHMCPTINACSCLPWTHTHSCETHAMMPGAQKFERTGLRLTWTWQQQTPQSSWSSSARPCPQDRGHTPLSGCSDSSSGWSCRVGGPPAPPEKTGYIKTLHQEHNTPPQLRDFWPFPCSAGHHTSEVFPFVCKGW